MFDVAVLTKAPVPGFAKTRLAPLLGGDGAAALQLRLIQRALQTAVASAAEAVTLWCAPDTSHPAFEEAQRRFGVTVAPQPVGDLGERMLAAFAAAQRRPLVLIGTDCPCLRPHDLEAAAAMLAGGAEAVIAPAEDGGYGLIAAARPLPELFADMPWGTDQVAALTREQASAANLRLGEIRTVWDIDAPADYHRLGSRRLFADDDLLADPQLLGA